MSNSDKDTLGKQLTAVGVTLAMAPVNAYVGAWTMSKLWQWFLQAQYGAGPTMAAWFGINVILGLLIGERLWIIAKDPSWDRSAGFIGRALALPICYMIALGACAALGSIMGWMA